MKFGGETAAALPRAYSVTSTIRPGSLNGSGWSEHLLHYGEDGGVRADAERDREHGRERESWRLSQHTQREHDVLSNHQWPRAQHGATFERGAQCAQREQKMDAARPGAFAWRIRARRSRSASSSAGSKTRARSERGTIQRTQPPGHACAVRGFPGP
jgi:hypothetical protein